MKRIARYLTPNIGTLIIVGLLFFVQGVGALPNSAPTEPTAPSQILISYQGTLTDKGGNPLNETVTMVFAIYGSTSGDDRKWGPETQSVAVNNGMFQVLLGSTAPLNSATLTGDLYLNIKVNGESLSPRERLTSTVYAVEAGTLSDWAETRGRLTVNGTLSVVAPDTGIYNLALLRTDESGREHKWRFWHMNEQYGKNELQIWEYAQDSNGQDCGGNVADGAMCDPRFTIAQGGDVTIDGNVTLTGDDLIIGSGTALRQDGSRYLHLLPYGGAGQAWDSVCIGCGSDADLLIRGNVSCGGLTEANLQTEEELATGHIDRFKEGDVLCWSSGQLEKCKTANDRRVQAVADKNGRPIVIGAEPIKVLGPVQEGDLLVASDVAGYAMVNNEARTGEVIAQALEDFDGEMGTIKAMIRKF